MKQTAVDTTVVVAGLSSWHAEHERAVRALAAPLRGDDRLLLPFVALVQSYSVLTRLPRGFRVSPADARDLLRSALEGRVRVVQLDPPAAWPLLDLAVERDVHGGGIYDFEILECAAAAGAKRLLTLNPDDFLRFGDRGVEIVVP